jgi:5'-nucleotidase
MKENRPLILICNDDGYQAKGLISLVDMVSDLGDIIVCAPDGSRSGQSRAFSMTKPLSLRLVSEKTGIKFYRCSGTPVDCVKMAYSELCPRKPDILIGGINHGDNASVNAHYSGTVGIVVEGAMKGIPSVAFSLCDYVPDADFSPMRGIVRKYTEKVLREGLPHFSCLNINFPLTEECKGERICRMAIGHWRKEVEKRQHPSGLDNYYWMSGIYQNDEPDKDDTDAWALAHGYAAVTPIAVDLTDYALLDKMTHE